MEGVGIRLRGIARLAFAILPRVAVSAPFQITLQNDLSGQLIDLLFLLFATHAGVAEGLVGEA